MELSSAKHKWFSCLDNTFFKMKESKLIEMQRKVEILGSALKKNLGKARRVRNIYTGYVNIFSNTYW